MPAYPALSVLVVIRSTLGDDGRVRSSLVSLQRQMAPYSFWPDNRTREWRSFVLRRTRTAVPNPRLDSKGDGTEGFVDRGGPVIQGRRCVSQVSFAQCSAVRTGPPVIPGAPGPAPGPEARGMGEGVARGVRPSAQNKPRRTTPLLPPGGPCETPGRPCRSTPCVAGWPTLSFAGAPQAA